MKKFLCYIALVLLIGVIATPPLLRKFYKDNEDEVKVVDVSEILSCVKDNYSISTSYINKTPINIKFKHLMEDPNIASLTDENSLEYFLDITLKEASVAKKEESVENVSGIDTQMISYGLIFNEANNDTLIELSDYKMTLEEQQTYYKANGYTCSVNRV